MKTQLAVAALALTLLVGGVFLYNEHHSKTLAETEVDFEFPIDEPVPECTNPPQEEVNEDMEYFDIRQQSQAQPGMLQGGGVMNCVYCGKNAYTGFKDCPAAWAQDGLDPYTDFKCIQAILKIPESCKICLCAISHRYNRRIRGC